MFEVHPTLGAERIRQTAETVAAVMAQATR